MDPATLLGAAGVLMVTALVAAAAPALQAACVDPVSTLSAED
jgi:ABC-type lipoprotein release transport system permease subunit